MLKFFLAICLSLIICSCSSREKGVPTPNYGYRYFVNKIVQTDKSTVGILDIPETCEYQFSREIELRSLNIPESEWHNYMKMNKWCSSLFKHQPDTTIYSLQNPSDTELCDSDRNCMVKPDIYLKDNNVFQISFCNSKCYTQTRYDSLNVLKDFVGEKSAWEPLSEPFYEIAVSDSLIVLKELYKYGKTIFFYVEKKEWCKDCPLEKDVSMYVPLPFGFVNSSVCSQKNDILF